MIRNSRGRLWLFIFLVVGVVHKCVPDRCGLDEVCQDVETCDEMKFFFSRNAEKIQNLTVCGTKDRTVRSSKSKKNVTRDLFFS